MTSQEHEVEVEARLRDLAERVAPPQVGPWEDVARGEQRIRRGRLVVAGAVLATAGVVGAGAALLPGGEAPGAVDVAGDGVTPSPDGQVREVVLPPGKGGGGLPGLDRFDPLLDHAAVLSRWNDVLAERLDPERAHLQPWTRETANVQTSGAGATLQALGSKYGWTNPGESGLGMLQVSVSTGWPEAEWFCDTGCEDVPAPGDAVRAEVETGAGSIAVAVEHADQRVVVLTLTTLLGNNSTVPLSGTDVGRDELLAAAADDRLALPEPGAQPPAIDPSRWQARGLEVLGSDGHRLTALGLPGLDASARAEWREGKTRLGAFVWEAVPTVGGLPDRCAAGRFVECRVRTLADGREVFVGSVRERWGGGWDVIHSGPAYDVLVRFEPHAPGADPGIERAVELAVDEAWQPVG